MKKITKAKKDNLFLEIKNLILKGRKRVLKAVNTEMVLTYFQIGKLIVEHEQKGEERAKYGQAVLKKLSRKLTKEFGKGFIKRNLELMRKFYLVYGKTNTVYSQFNFKLSWSHYVLLMRFEESKRKFYEIESIQNSWSLRELKRQADSALFERIALSKNKKRVLEKNLRKYHSPEKPEDVVKDPYILEFLGLDEKDSYSENKLEQIIIDNLQNFLLELGKGFSFVGRQKRFTFDEDHYFVDLVFYNRLLKCFVLIDLKIGKLKHQDLGQMQMYVNYYDRKIKTKEENPTIGIILCQNKKETMVKMTLPKRNKQIFASNYLPSKKALIDQIKKAKEEFKQSNM
jgi:predicted nuclease of restriction endonuclease-like (RecB) superfamily